jgi:hypothetical protein
VKILLLLLAGLAPGVRVDGPEAEAATLGKRVPVLLAEVERGLGFTFEGDILVKLARDDAEFAELAGPKPPWVVAVARPAARTLVVRLSAVGAARATDVSGVLRHELVHLLLPQRIGGARVPLWFEEGLAQVLGGRINRADRDLVPTAAATGRLIPLADLARRFPEEGSRAALAYAQGESAATWLIETYGLPDLLDRVRVRGSLEAALRQDFGTSFADVEEAWRGTLRERGWWLPLLGRYAIPLLLFIASLLVIVGFLKARRRGRRIYDDLPD